MDIDLRKQIIDLRKRGFTYRQILKETGLKSTSTVFYHLKKMEIETKTKTEIIDFIFSLRDEIYKTCGQEKLKKMLEEFLE
ncbi:MAG: hypothetical protein WC648_04120 [Candidatus Paceibacterota bacterium]|jgi:hypothetical protein